MAKIVLESSVEQNKLPSYTLPMLRAGFIGLILGSTLATLVGLAVILSGLGSGHDQLIFWAIAGGVIGFIQASSHVGLLIHRQRQELIHGHEDDH
jgi:hypothetical protein